MGPPGSAKSAMKIVEWLYLDPALAAIAGHLYKIVYAFIPVEGVLR
jgi:hypothetical protein